MAGVTSLPAVQGFSDTNGTYVANPSTPFNIPQGAQNLTINWNNSSYSEATVSYNLNGNPFTFEHVKNINIINNPTCKDYLNANLDNTTLQKIVDRAKLQGDLYDLRHKEIGVERDELGLKNDELQYDANKYNFWSKAIGEPIAASCQLGDKICQMVAGMKLTNAQIRQSDAAINAQDVRNKIAEREMDLKEEIQKATPGMKEKEMEHQENLARIENEAEIKKHESDNKAKVAIHVKKELSKAFGYYNG